MPSDAAPEQSGENAISPFAVSLEDLEAGVHVPLEDQVAEEDTEVPPLPSDAERRRAEEWRVITHGG